MRFGKKLYLTEGIADSRRLRYRLKHGKVLRGLYLISICPGVDELEIYHCAFLRQSFYRKYPLKIVGIADSYKGALLLVEQMVQDIYEKTGEYKLKDYLERQFRRSKG